MGTAESKKMNRRPFGQRPGMLRAADASLVRAWSITALAVRNLFVNKLRTFLTLLGIIVGVASMIAVVTIIQGLNETVANTFSANGSTVFSISKGPSVITSREQMLKVGKRRDVTEEDAEAVERGCPLCWRIGYSARGSEIVKYAEKTEENVTIRGITLSQFDIEDLAAETGRVWTGNEADAGHYVAVIGADIVKNVFGDAPPETVIGRQLRIRGATVRVIGIVAPLGSILGVSRDNFILVPYNTSLKILPGRGSLVINVQVQDPSQLENAKDQATAVMRARRGMIAIRTGDVEEFDEGFTVESADVFVGLYSDATSNIYLVTIGVSAISLIVGGIVVMNIMLVSVAERTKEIGLRMAVGARRSDIMRQFMTEAVVIAAAGGVIGLVLGFALANLISLLIGFPTLINLMSVVLGIGVSSVVGVISGLYPAWRAAQLNPVEAMRRE